MLISLLNLLVCFSGLENKNRYHYNTVRIIGGSVESPKWLFLTFCPKIFGGGRGPTIVILLEKECSIRAADNVRDTQTLIDGFKNVFALSGSGDAKTFRIFLAPEG